MATATTLPAKLPRIPTPEECDAAGEYVENPGDLCANWRRGCNATTNGPKDGRLTKCDECAALAAAEGRANV